MPVQHADRPEANAQAALKPMLLQVCCNLATMTHPLFDKQPVPYALFPKVSNPRSIEAALGTAVDMLSKVRTFSTCLRPVGQCFTGYCDDMHLMPGVV